MESSVNHPYIGDKLTKPEQDVQRAQEKRTCQTCSNAQIHQRGGARLCVEPDAPDPIDVMAGRPICDYYR